MEAHAATAPAAGHRVATVAIADVVGYSLHLARDEDGTLARLAALRRDVVGPAMENHRGRLVKTLGDGVLAEFPVPIEGVACAAAVLRQIAEQNQSLPEDERVDIRIGLHCGDIVDVSGDIFGTTVNVAARLEAMGKPGEICVSAAVLDQIRDQISGTPKDLGVIHLRNISEKIHAYSIQPDCVAVHAGRSAVVGTKQWRRPAVAVLPFEVVGGNEDDAYFGEGIAEDLIGALSRYRWFFVISQNSSFAFGHRREDPRRIAVHLGVRYIVDGTIRRASNRLRITARLVDGHDGSQVWAGRYDRAAGDVFAIQDEIVEAIAATVEPELELKELALSRRKRPEKLEAQDCYYRAHWHFYLITKTDNEISKDWYRRALDLEPGFARARAGLAYTYYNDAVFGFAANPGEAVAEGTKLALEAVALDPNDAFAHHVVGRLYMLAGRHDASIAELQHAIELNPNNALAHYGLGFSLVMNGEPARALPLLERAQRLSPHDQLLWAFVTVTALAQQLLGAAAEAEYSARRAVDSPNAGFWAWLQLAIALGYRNKVDEAGHALEEARRLRPEFSIAMLDQIFTFRDPALREKYVEGLRLAGLTEDVAEGS